MNRVSQHINYSIENLIVNLSSHANPYEDTTIITSFKPDQNGILYAMIWDFDNGSVPYGRVTGSWSFDGDLEYHNISVQRVVDGYYHTLVRQDSNDWMYSTETYDPINPWEWRGPV